MRRKRAFTLVELLVVIGIIVILIAILLPVLSRAKRQAQMVVCQANLRTVGQGLMMYVDEQKYYPGGWINFPGAPGTVAIWPTLIRKYLGNSRKPFYCPARDATFMWNDPLSGPKYGPIPALQVPFGYGPSENVLMSTTDGSPGSTPFSYSYNYAGAGGILNPVRLGVCRGLGWLVSEHSGLMGGGYEPLIKGTRVKKPAEMIAIADSCSEFGNFLMAAAEWPHRGPGNIHQGGANVLFCDGHVQWHLQKELVVADWQHGNEPIRRYWNNDNEP